MPPRLAYLVSIFTGSKPPPPAGVPAKPPRRLPLRLRLYIALVALAFACFLGIELAHRLNVTAQCIVVAATLALLVTTARMFPVRLAPKRKLSVDTAPSFAAVILLPAPLSMLAGAAGMFGGEIRSRSPWFQTAFNTAVSGLRVGAAALTYRLLAGIPQGEDVPVRVHVPGLVLAAIAFYLTSSLLVDIAAGLTLGQNPFTGWMAMQRRKAPTEIVLLLLGIFAALPARENPWLLPLLVVPAAIVRHSLQDGLPIKSETREALEALAEAVDLRHQRSADHSHRVAELARSIARRMDLSPRDISIIADAARLRDIGEVSLPPDLLANAHPLSDDQRAEMRRHAAIGAEMVQRFADFDDCAVLILRHHERWDGWGAPDGLTGEAIPLGARIIAVAETYEALIASRPYRDALTAEQARGELRRAAGSQLDPAIVKVLLEMLGDGAAADTAAAGAIVRLSRRTIPRGGDV